MILLKKGASPHAPDVSADGHVEQHPSVWTIISYYATCSAMIDSNTESSV